MAKAITIVIFFFPQRFFFFWISYWDLELYNMQKFYFLSVRENYTLAKMSCVPEI